MVNERTLELVRACFKGIFKGGFDNIELLEVKSGPQPRKCIFIDAGYVKYEMYKGFKDVSVKSFAPVERRAKVATFTVRSFDEDGEQEDECNFDSFPRAINWMVGGLTYQIIDDVLLAEDMAHDLLDMGDEDERALGDT